MQAQSKNRQLKGLPTTAAVHASRLYQEVAARMRKAIMAGGLQAGDPLPTENELAREFGVSRVVVREAIHRLRHDGLVGVRQGSGAFVTVPSTDVVVTALSAVLDYKRTPAQDLHEVREVLEVAIAGLAAEKASEDDKAALAHTIQAMKAAMQSPEEYVELDLLYHGLLARATGNCVFDVLLRSLVELLRDSRLAAIQAPADAVQRSYAAHVAIQEAVEAGKREEACGAMRLHLREVRERLQLAASPADKGSHRSRASESGDWA